ncbi:MAG: PD40 domain-containing protein [Sedimentisphaerales bacterium]|nr:PD40 domain-containing protein [Sedimentisphaerales bacterium]
MKAKLKKTRKAKLIYAIIGCALITIVLLYVHLSPKGSITQYRPIDQPAKILPDYSSAMIPPNIAPLNFLIQHEGAGYFVRVSCEKGKPIEIFSKSPSISIPKRAWQKLLDANRSRKLSVDIFVKSSKNTSSTEKRNEEWLRFQTVTCDIAREDIDPYLVYRRIRPDHSTWREMGIYQRHLSSFDESVILDSGYFKNGCVNCHSFCGHRTDKTLIGIRSTAYGSSALLLEGDRAQKIGTKFGYTSWHPSGRLAAFSVNKVKQMFHSAAAEVRDVIDFDSLMAYYLVDSKTVKTTKDLARKDRLETYPAWSADGRYLYFCSAPITWPDRTTVPESYDQIKYDLVRMSYDLDRDRWGSLETVLSADQTALSILLPRVSPDGRWLLFCMCDYGCFPVYRHSSDLYMMDLDAARQTGEPPYRRLDINSDKSESWHSWSSNGRWIVFSSKRDSGVFTRIYIAYVDENGKVYKPVRLPQKDPAHYDSCLWTYSVPELITEPVRLTKEKLGRIVRGSQKIPIEMPVTMATPKAGQPLESQEPWQAERE